MLEYVWRMFNRCQYGCRLFTAEIITTLICLQAQQSSRAWSVVECIFASLSLPPSLHHTHTDCTFVLSLSLSFSHSQQFLSTVENSVFTLLSDVKWRAIFL